MRLQMSLLLVGKVESFMINRNLDLVEEALKICISIDRVEKIFIAQCSILRKGVETIDQYANVSITGRNRRECGVLQTDLELSSFFDLG